MSAWGRQLHSQCCPMERDQEISQWQGHIQENIKMFWKQETCATHDISSPITCPLAAHTGLICSIKRGNLIEHQPRLEGETSILFPPSPWLPLLTLRRAKNKTLCVAKLTKEGCGGSLSFCSVTKHPFNSLAGKEREKGSYHTTSLWCPDFYGMPICLIGRLDMPLLPLSSVFSFG